MKWRVVNSSGVESSVPGVCFLVPPPDKEAVDAVDRLKRQFDRSVALWQKKQLRMRQNMIFATIKVVKSWDLAQVCLFFFCINKNVGRIQNHIPAIHFQTILL